MPPRPRKKFEELSSFEQKLALLAEREGVSISALGLAVQPEPLSKNTVAKWCNDSRKGRLPFSQQFSDFAKQYRLSVTWLRDPKPVAYGSEIPGPDWVADQSDQPRVPYTSLENVRNELYEVHERSMVDEAIGGSEFLGQATFNPVRAYRELDTRIRDRIADRMKGLGAEPSSSPKARGPAKPETPAVSLGAQRERHERKTDEYAERQRASRPNNARKKGDR